MKQPLDAGDTVELAITLSQDYQVVRAGATSTVRPGETPEAAMERLGGFLYGVADQELGRII